MGGNRLRPPGKRSRHQTPSECTPLARMLPSVMGGKGSACGAVRLSVERSRLAIVIRRPGSRERGFPGGCLSANYVVFLHHHLCTLDVRVVPLDLLVIRAFQVRANTLLVVPLRVRNV